MKNKKLQLQEWGRGILVALLTVGALGLSQEAFAKAQKNVKKENSKKENTKIWKENLGSKKNDKIIIKNKKDATKEEEVEWKEVLGVEEPRDNSTSTDSVKVDLKANKDRKNKK